MRILPLHISFVCLTFLICANTYSQTWKSLRHSANSDTSVIYRWHAADRYHSAYGELILLKSGKFFYNSARPLNNREYSEGVYTMKKDTLILNSVFQEGTLPIRVDYSDTTSNGSDRRLSFAQNSKGEKLRSARYLFNNDT